jgi:hypothetical protein
MTDHIHLINSWPFLVKFSRALIVELQSMVCSKEIEKKDGTKMKKKNEKKKRDKFFEVCSSPLFLFFFSLGCDSGRDSVHGAGRGAAARTFLGPPGPVPPQHRQQDRPLAARPLQAAQAISPAPRVSRRGKKCMHACMLWVVYFMDLSCGGERERLIGKVFGCFLLSKDQSTHQLVFLPCVRLSLSLFVLKVFCVDVAQLHHANVWAADWRAKPGWRRRQHPAAAPCPPLRASAAQVNSDKKIKMVREGAKKIVLNGASFWFLISSTTFGTETFPQFFSSSFLLVFFSFSFGIAPPSPERDSRFRWF